MLGIRMSGTSTHQCRFCGGSLSIPFCDLGATPLANAYVAPGQTEPDPTFPLNAMACEACHLVQLTHTADASAIFADYAYFSSYSSTWLNHAAAFAHEAIIRFQLSAESFVAEVASNDGYLLRNFIAAGIPSLGVEPAANIAATAVAAGIPTEVSFFGVAAAERIVAARGHADLVIANNVLAHVPDVNDFVAGLALLAGPKGAVSIEAPHLLSLIAGMQFDTIYHEHFFYWSLHAMESVLRAHGLYVSRVDRLPTHGGSLRVTAKRTPSGDPGDRNTIRDAEAVARLDRPEGYAGFGGKVGAILSTLREHLQCATHDRVAAYGAAAKGNTLLNAAGITSADIRMVADRNPTKQGRLLPGSRIPVVAPAALLEFRPKEVLILPWNIADEIAGELAPLVAQGSRLTTAIPELRVVG